MQQLCCHCGELPQGMGVQVPGFEHSLGSASKQGGIHTVLWCSRVVAELFGGSHPDAP